MKQDPYPWNTCIKDYWTLLDGRRFKFVFYTIMVSISNAIPFIVAYLLGMIVDFFVQYSQGNSLSKFYFLAISIGLLGGFQVWLRFYGKDGLKKIAGKIRREVRIGAMSKIMDLELKWHDKEETGSKIQKINEGGRNVYEGLSRFGDSGIYILTGLIVSLSLFLVLNIKYFVFALVFLSIYLYGEHYFNKKVTYWQDKKNKIMEKVSGKMHESTTNLLTVKSLGLKDAFKKTNATYEKKLYDVIEKSRATNHLKFKTIKIFSAISYGLFILMIGLDASVGAISVGSIFVFVSYFSRLKGTTDMITNEIMNFITIKSLVGRFMTIFGIKILDKEEDLLDVPKDWKTIEFSNITFKYKNHNILDNFNLKINKNDEIGVVGRSGCGKSTLTKLLLGLYKPQEGHILIDGKDLKKYKHKSITDTIGIVLQESEMFNTSLLENVTISSVKNDLKIFKKAIKIAQLNDLIKKFPKGVRTLIGEKGYHLSGGERQRIGIARAVYKDSPFLILDEATSSLDSRTESLIQESIDKQLDDKTLLIIAHRLSTLKNVNKIIVMEKGKIVEQGTYDELLRKRGSFYKLWSSQKSWKRV